MVSRKLPSKHKTDTAIDERTFRFMFEEHSAVMLLIDPQTGDILDANQAAANFYGCPQSDLRGMSISKINTLPPKQTVEEFQKALKKKRNYFIFTHRLSNGEERIVEVHSSPITLQERQALFSIIHDITERRQAEEALKESEAHYRAVAQSANDAIVSSDSAGNIASWNSGAEKIFGYTEAEVIGLPATLTMPSQAQDKHMAAMLLAQTSGENPLVDKTVEVTGLRKDGSEFPLEISLAEWQSHKGKFYTAIMRDISARKQRDTELYKSEERYRTLFNSMMDGIYRSTHDGKFVDVNPAMVKMFGYSSREEMLAVDIKKELYFTPEERGSHILDTGQEEIEVYRMRRKDGSEIWVEDHGYYVHDEQGMPIYHEGMLRDITQRKRAEEIIRESEERLAAVMEGSQLGYSDWNIQTGEVLRNERWAGMLGYTLNELKSTYQQWQDLIHPDDRAAALQARQDHLDGKIPIHRDEYRLRAKDGTYRWILDQGRIIEHDPQGHPLRLTATHTDITSRKQAEAELRQAKDALEMTHKKLEQAFAREQQLARIDALTGVNNRRYLFELAEHEFNAAIRYRPPLSVLMFDVDDFKLINDNFGHAIGDQALQHLTQVVRTKLRSADVIGRYGGDEFIVLLPQTSAQEARPLAERIHASIAAIHMETDKGPLTLTISLGIAQTIYSTSEPDSVESLLLRADQALYAAKQAGRNRTVIFDVE
jgi:diguanylate cyclase (GGDEF)-like protein/PAS domain S-box-containing protein